MSLSQRSLLLDHDWIDSPLAAAAWSQPDGLAIVSENKETTWQELLQQVDSLASHYLSLGLAEGDRVASLMPNSCDLVVHYLACLRAGLVATPLNYRYTSHEIDHALRISGASLLVYHGERAPDLSSCQQVAKLKVGVIQSHGQVAAHYTGQPTLEDLLSRQAAPLPLTSKAPDAPAFLYFTSGSTGKPKAVTHTRRTFNQLMGVVIASLELTADDTMMPGSSLSHIGGTLFGLATLAVSGTLVVPETANGDSVLPLIRRYRPSVLWMLPVALIRLVHHHPLFREDFQSVRLCFSGGDRVSAELEREFFDLTGLVIDESYGMTEIGMAMITPPSESPHRGSVGRLCPGIEARLLTDNGNEVAQGTPGRLWIRSTSVMNGYWNDEATTEKAMRDGWFDTGDLMCVDNEGFFRFCGRQKHIIIHDGSNICPQEIEDCLEEHPAVEKAGVVGVQDPFHGENVYAFVTLLCGVNPPSPEALIRFAQSRVGYKAPEQIVILKRMPTNPTGKVDRPTLTKQAELDSRRSDAVEEHATPIEL